MPPHLTSEGLLDLFPMERSEGAHVSDRIRRLLRATDPSRFRGDPPNQTRLNLGNALEHAIADALARRDPDRYTRLGELQLGGLTGTPDLMDVADWAVMEIKLTWMGCRDLDIEDTKFWHYWVQLKAYAKMIGCHKGRLLVVFVNGDYRESGPQGFEWEWEFTQDELDENWQMLLAAVDD